MKEETILTVITLLFVPFAKWYLDIKLEEQTEQLNKIIELNNNKNNKQIYSLEQQLFKIIKQFNCFHNLYENDVKILKSKLLDNDESISRETFK